MSAGYRAKAVVCHSRAVEGWAVGKRVGVGWFGGAFYHCEPCRRGHMIDCRNLRIPGIN